MCLFRSMFIAMSMYICKIIYVCIHIHILMFICMYIYITINCIVLHPELYPSEHLSLRHVSGEGTPVIGENMLKPPQFDGQDEQTRPWHCVF